MIIDSSAPFSMSSDLEKQLSKN